MSEVKSVDAGDVERLSSGRTLSANMVWNMLGMGLPVLVAVATIPALIHRMGEDRFGVLTIAWLIFGYFSIFDMGLHRALTQLVSKALGMGDRGTVTPLFWTALTLMGLAGMLGGGAVVLVTPWLVGWIQMPEAIAEETRGAFYLMALGMPVLTATAGLRGMLEAHQKFLPVACVQLWHGVWTFAGSLAVALWNPSLTWVVGGLIAGRVVTVGVYFVLATRAAPQVWERVAPSRSVLRPLLTYGGWMTLTHAVVPWVLYGDRLIIGAVISAEAVTLYVTPAEMVVKLLLIPSALIGVLFPAFAATYRTDLSQTRRLFRLGLKLIYLSFLPVAILGVALAPEALRLWLDASFEQRSSVVLKLLFIGVFLNGTGILFSSLVQGMGQPWITALVYCVELPVFGALTWWLTGQYGIEGAAVAWASRQAVDALVLLLFARALLQEQFATIAKQVSMATAAVLALGILMTLEGLVPRLVLAAALLALVALLGWTVMFTASERSKLKTLLGRR